MKKSLISFILIMFIIFPCFGMVFSFTIQNYASADSLTFEEFHEKVMEASKNDNLNDYIYIDKNCEFDEIEKSLSLNDSGKFFQKTSNKKLDYQQLKTICENNDYVIEEEENVYKLRNKYSLKRLLVFGEVKNTYNASTLITGYEDHNILCYNSEDETKNAYLNLIQDKSLNVLLDTVITVNDFETKTNSYDYSSYNSWGAEAMDLGVYNEFLVNNGVDKETVVVVLDTGICTNHEMFKNRLLEEDGNYVGYSYTTSKYESYTGYKFEDDQGHGTHVAGIICDLTPSNVKILPIKVLNSEGEGSLLSSLYGLQKVYNTYSEKYNIVCTNLSLGAEINNLTSANSYKKTFDDIFIQLREKGILSCTSSGNGATDTAYNVPANCDYAIVVGALDKSGSTYSRRITSNYGATVDISAPGGSINSAYIDVANPTTTNKYALKSGTSMASPHVAASVALLCLDKNYHQNEKPDFTAEEIESRLLSSSIDLGFVGKDKYYGVGMVNLANTSAYLQYSVENYEDVYDGQHHNITIKVLNTNTYTIKYGLTKGNYKITDFTQYDEFKNATNGDMYVYFQITSNFATIESQAKLNINPIDIYLNLQDEYPFTYGDVNLDEIDIDYTGNVIDGDKIEFSIETSANNQSEVGIYTMSVKSANANYRANYEKAPSIKIVKRPITIKLTSREITYGETISTENASFEVVSGSIVNNDQLNIRIKSIGGKNVGEYPIEFNKYYTYRNYEVTAIEGGILKINPRKIELSLENQSSIYGEDIEIDTASYRITSGSIIEGDDLGLQLSTTANPMQAGEYPLKYKLHTNGNYELTVTEAKYIVEAIKIEILCKDKQTIYGESIVFEETDVEIVSGAFLPQDNIKIELISAANAQSNVGEYEISIVEINNSNYLIEVTKATLNIIQRDLNLAIVKKEYFYGETINNSNLEFTLESGEIVNNDTVNITLSTPATSGCDIGDYRIAITNSNNNYSIVLDSDEITIKQRPITIEFESQEYTYGESIYINFKVTSGSIVNNDSLGIITQPISTDVGEYPIIFDSYTNLNYDLTVIDGATIKISPIKLRILLNDQSSMYGVNIEIDTTLYTIKSGSIIEGDDLGLQLSTTANPMHMGEYPLTYQSHTNNNYQLTVTNAKYIVVGMSVEIVCKDKEITYGESINLSETDYEIVSGSFHPDDNIVIEVTTTATAQSGVGEYEISINVTNNIKYKIDVNKGTLKIVPRVLNLLIEKQEFVYGNTINISNIEFELINDSTIVKNDVVNISFSTTATNRSYVGEYPIFATSSNNNYSIVLNNDVLTIKQRAIVIEIEQSSIYGNTVNVQNNYKLVEGIIVNSDTLNLSLSTTATNRSNIGEYPITIEKSNQNYQITLRKGIYTITKRTMTVIAAYQEGIYGEKPNLNQNAYSISGLISGDDPLIVLTTDATKESNVGNYQIFAQTENENYLISNLTGSYKIKPRPITIQLLQQNIKFSFNIKYDTQAYKITEGDIVNGDDLLISIYPTEKMFGLAGTYEITAVSDNTNYEVTVLEGTAIIEFSIISFLVIFIPVCLLSAAGIAVYFVKRKHNNEKYLKDDI